MVWCESGEGEGKYWFLPRFLPIIADARYDIRLAEYRTALADLLLGYIKEERGEWKEMVVIAGHLQDLQLQASAHIIILKQILVQ